MQGFPGGAHPEPPEAGGVRWLLLGGASPGGGGPGSGSGLSPEEGARSFATLPASPGISALSAVRNGRAYGLWQLFNDTPLHIVAIEALAKWIHPERFADLDPQATLKEISTRFSAIPLEGTLWIDGTARGRR